MKQKILRVNVCSSQTSAEHGSADLAGFQIQRDQQHPALMIEPYGGIVSKQSSLVPSLRYKKQLKRVIIDQFIAYNNLIINRVDTLKGTFDWYGNFTPNSLKNGESTRPSLSEINNQYFTSRTHLKYPFQAAHTLEFNQTFTTAHRSGKDPLGATFLDTGIDVLTLPSSYEKRVSSLGLNSLFFDQKLDLITMVKYFGYKASGVETYQSLEISSTDAKTTSGNTWGIAEGIKYRINNYHIARFSAEYSNRLPDHSEIFGDGVWIVQNFGIQPEHSINMNLGWRTSLPQKFTLDLNTFYRRTQNMILLIPIQSPYARYENQQNVKGPGFEIDGRINLSKRLEFTANGTYQNMRLFGITATQDQWKNDARLRNTPFLFGNLGIDYQTPALLNGKLLLKANAFYSYLHEYYLETIPKRFEGKGLFGTATVNTLLIIPNQHLVNTGFLASFPEKRISLGFDIKNLLNKDIYDNYRVQRAGRSFNFKINYTIYANEKNSN